MRNAQPRFPPKETLRRCGSRLYGASYQTDDVSEAICDAMAAEPETKHIAILLHAIVSVSHVGVSRFE